MNGSKRWRSRGMTLLEVMLALTLTAFVLVSISMAIDLHLRMLDSRRNDVERIQVARAVLKLIANDLRSTVQPSPIDFSSLASLAASSAGGAAAMAAIEEATGGAGGEDTGGDASADLGTDGTETESASTDIAATETAPMVPGLYGNQYELQLDVSRLPRVDELQRIAATMPGEMVDIPSDVKTVAYFFHDPNNPVSSGDFRDAAGNPQSGLVRRVMDRAVTLYASTNASMTSLQNTGELIAPEIAGIQFEYFDGLEWVYEWDSDQMCGLPQAVRITVIMMPREYLQSKPGNLTVATATNQLGADVVPETYSLTVRLPAATPPDDALLDQSGLESVGLE